MFGGFAFFPPVIKYLLISNVLIFLFQYFVLTAMSNQTIAIQFMKLFALNPIGSTVFPFYPWQLITYLFMHGGFLHLFLNMFALWMFGMELENIWGSKKFLTYYMVCGVGAGLANLFLSPLLTDINVPTIGALGAIYGVLVAFGMMFPERPIFLYFLFPIKAKYFVIIYMVIELISVGSQSGIAHIAHLGGALVGFIYMMISNYDITRLFKFNQGGHSIKKTSNRPSNIYRNKYYEKYNYAGSDDVSDANYYEEKDKDENGVSQEKIDEILDKISKYGYKNLTEEEKRILFEASKKIH